MQSIFLYLVQVTGRAAITFLGYARSQSRRLQKSVIYQPLGRGVALQDATGVVVENNILVYSKGHACSLEGASTVNITMKGNLFIGAIMNSLLEPKDLEPAAIYSTSWTNSIR